MSFFARGMAGLTRQNAALTRFPSPKTLGKEKQTNGDQEENRVAEEKCCAPSHGATKASGSPQLQPQVSSSPRLG